VKKSALHRTIKKINKKTAYNPFFLDSWIFLYLYSANGKELLPIILIK